MIISEAARDRRASREILGNKRTHHVALEALFVVDHVIRNADVLSHAAGVVNIVERAAAAGYLLGHALVPGQPALVPKLHGQADDVVPLGAQHARDRGGIDSARHGYGDGLGIWHVLKIQQLAISNREVPIANCQLLSFCRLATTLAAALPSQAPTPARCRCLLLCSACPG